MSFRDVQNPGIGGLEELTTAEELFVQNLAGLSYAQGDILYHNGTNIVRLPKGTGTQHLAMNAGATAPEWVAAGGTGTVTSVSVVTANGVSGSVATATTTPAITLSLGAITPTSVNGLTLASQAVGFTIAGGTTSKTLTVPLDATVSGTNTGDQTNITGNAGTVTIGNEATDTTCFPLFVTDATGSLSPKTVATFTFNSNTSALTATTFIGALSGNATTATDTVSKTGTGSTYATSISPVFTTPTLGVASATSIATSAATPLLLTNGQLVNIALTSQTVGATTLTIPDFANVVDEFTFKTKAQTMSNKTFVAPILGTPTSGTLTNCTGLPVAGIVASTSTALGVGSIELGHASDTTIARASAGVVSIEGVNVVTTSSTDTLSNKTLTAPKFADAGFIADNNGNEQIKFSTTASAVNEITIKNSATTTNPQIQATGGDTNIGIDFVPKGTGIVKGELKRFMVRLLSSTTDQTVGTTIGGDYRISNRAITIKAVGSYCDTAGTTGTYTIDINEAGTTILSTKITVDSTEKSSETAATPPVISDSAIAADAIITFDIDAIQTTAAKGLVVWCDYVYA